EEPGFRRTIGDTAGPGSLVAPRAEAARLSSLGDCGTGQHRIDSRDRTSKETSMAKVKNIGERARPLDHQKAHEIQPYGQVARLRNALSEKAVMKMVEN